MLKTALDRVRGVIEPYILRYVPSWLREQVARIMCTTIAFFFAFTTGDEDRYSARAYSGIRVFMPIHMWGCMFGLTATLMMVGILTKRLKVLGWGLVATASLHIFISVGFFIQATHDSRASFAGAVAFASIAASIIAARIRLAQNTGS